MNEITNNFSLERVLDEYLQDKEPRDTTKHFYVSGLGSCYRQRILQRLGKQPIPFNPRTKRIFAIGNLNHAFLQDVLEKSGYLLEKEIPCKWPEYELSGRADALAQTPSGLLLYEFKNTQSRKILYGKIDEQYILQGICYLMLLNNKEYNNSIKQLRICLISRDDLIIKEVGYELTTELKDRVIKELDILMDWWKKRDIELPPELEKGNWRCGYCGYIEYCPEVMKWKKTVGSAKNPTELKDSKEIVPTAG